MYHRCWNTFETRGGSRLAIKRKNTPEVHCAINKGSAKIFFTPDEANDYDDSDPDDDLDI